ncbi:hypothetical protein [Arthrobacter sp. 9V]|uniref:hypothetical protein n=1 Tax=Arthrobacter sp. 9V TaxID=2653132 RepID=UPI001356F0AD|nr:hypothetical protein [Arthrobacter sp. 9V]
MIIQHFALIASGVLVVFCAIRILIFAAGDVSIALAVLNTGQQFTILTSTLFSLVSAASFFGLFLPQLSKYVFPNVPASKSILSTGLQSVLLPLCVIVAILTLPVLQIAMGTAGLALLAVMSLIQARKRKRGTARKATDAVNRGWIQREGPTFLVSMIVVTQATALVSTPWVPTETISVNQGDQQREISGYVIGEQGKQTLVVAVKRNAVTWISEDNLKERFLCASGGKLQDWYWKPLTEVFPTPAAATRPARPECKEG